MDLTCYVYSGWKPRLRPASQKRDWMENTPERFAYRCLPLAIANAHGWELLSPVGFEARWNGGRDTDGVEIRLDPGSPLHQAPVSLFGQGTFTFHVEGLFRTSPGWNLWVGGPPNGAKDGVAPLGGVIETDWSPYSFTMNWRFTRRDHWIRFEENEPFAFLFPVQRGALDGVTPEIRPIDEEPELKAQFEAWSKSRDAFQKWVKETNPSAPADKWQKLYYRGVGPAGQDGPDDHQSKLRLDPFVQPDGKPASWPEMKGCPVSAQNHLPAEPKPAIFAAAGGGGAKGAALAGLTGVADDRLQLTLRTIGFDAKPQVPEIEPWRKPATAAAEPVAAAPARAEPAAPAAPPQDRAARQRDWHARVAERQRALAGGSDAIARVPTMNAQVFLERFYAPGRPVVITGAFDRWPARKRWTPDYLAKTVGPAPVEFQANRGSDPDFELYKDRHKETAPFDAFMRRIAQPGNDAYLTAYNSGTNAKALAVLQRDLGTLPAYLTDAPGMLWIGPGGTFTPLHFDLTNNLLAQVVGTKEIVLLPPSETERLANQRHVFSEVHDIEDEARFARFPQARNAKRYKVALKPGELLYIPIGWWHQVRARDFSVTLTYTNFRWPNDGYEGFPSA